MDSKSPSKPQPPNRTASESGTNWFGSSFQFNSLPLFTSRGSGGEGDDELDVLPRATSKADFKKEFAYLEYPKRDLLELARRRQIHIEHGASKADIIESLKENEHGAKHWIEDCWEYEIFWLVVVVCNAFFIGLEIDYNWILSEWQWYAVNCTFVALFTFECIFKAWQLGLKKYLKGGWNQFDLIVTTLALVQLAAALDAKLNEKNFHAVYGHIQQMVSAESVQILRLFRLARLARIFRTPKVLIAAFLTSVKALAWILLLLGVWLYLCACFTTLFIGKRGVQDGEDAEEIQELRARFATIGMSMFALFEVMTLEGWTDYVRPFLHTRYHLVWFFLMFIFIAAFFILNLITAVVVDRTVAAQQEMEESESKNDESIRSANIHLIYNILRNWNKDAPDPDVIDEKHFEACLDKVDGDRELREAMSSPQVKWNQEYMTSMFRLLDHDGNGKVSLKGYLKLLEMSHQPLDVSNYIRFQVNMAQRLDFQERLICTVIDAMDQMSSITASASGEKPILSSVDRSDLEIIKIKSMLMANESQKSPLADM